MEPKRDGYEIEVRLLFESLHELRLRSLILQKLQFKRESADLILTIGPDGFATDASCNFRS